MILVTGGAGYIGSHTVKALRQDGFEPLIFDNFSTGHRSFVRDTAYVEGDVCSPVDLKMCSAPIASKACFILRERPWLPNPTGVRNGYYQANVGGGINLLSAMKIADVKHLIFSSTCATYGIPQTVPIREESPQFPINPYGETKLAFERALRWFHEAHGLEYLSLRYFNAAGADADGEFGEDHDPETHLIPLVLDAASGRRPHVKIFGTDYSTPDGTCQRDYIHVADLARAHVMGLRALMEKRVESQAINLGTGRGHSVREVVDTVRRVTQSNFSVQEEARRPGDPPVLVAQVDRAAERLRWSAETSGLEQIVTSAWNWHQLRFQSPS